MSRHILKMKHPAAWHNEQWREALMLGNGLTGILVHGAIAEERIQFNRHEIWNHGTQGGEIPDISETFQAMRKQILEGDYRGANKNQMAAALKDKGYFSALHTPSPLGTLQIFFTPETMFTGYERTLNMRTGEACVRFRLGETDFERRAFVSRDADIAVFSFKSSIPFTAAYKFEMRCAEDSLSEFGEKSFSCRTADGSEGVKVWFIGDISTREANHKLEVTGCNYLAIVQAYARQAPKDISAELSRSYEELLSRHCALHTPLYDAVSIELADDAAHDICNEHLLLEAYDAHVSPVLLEKLWRFGRYLFISASAENGIPVPLYGLWHGEDGLIWSQYVANENVQMTYWHAMAGGLSYFIVPLIRYYTEALDAFRECAQKLFGMRGAWVSAFTSPAVGGPSTPVGVIINWIGCGGWLSRHFWEYYQYTHDMNMLKEHILPFMHEIALFYLDYVTLDENGHAFICPSVSPENTPGNLIPEFFREEMGHIAPAVKNATMDFAIMKELLTHFLEGIEVTGMYAEDADACRALLASIPEYSINADGAVKEWMAPDLEDFYNHRHLSHIYPVFPGDEINSQNAPELFEAFRRAVDLRKLGGQSGWSLAHMSNIYARMGEGERALECIDILAKSVVNNALITTHNDWRHMGMTLDQHEFAPVQLDANFGVVNVLQEMLFRWSEGYLFILPALPERLREGKVRGIVFPHGKADIAWNPSSVTLTLFAAQDFSAEILLRNAYIQNVTMQSGECLTLEFTR